MSKGKGQKIAIKFDKPLLGDVSGNESAFTITGMVRNPLGVGELEQKQFAVNKVERYPITTFWNDDLGDGIKLYKPEMSITDAQCYETTNGTTLIGTVNANAGDFILATISHRSTFTTPAGWTKIYESAETDPTWKQRMVFAIKQVDSAGQVSFKATQSTAGRMYLNLISISGIQGIEFVPELEVVNLPSTSKPVSVPDKVENEMLIWGCTAPLWKSPPAPYGDWVTSPNDLTLVSLNQATTQPRQASFIDDGTGQATGRTFNHSPTTTDTECIIAAVRLISEHEPSKMYETQVETTELSNESRIRWDADLPEGTNIIAEYAISQETPEEWTSVENEEVIEISPTEGYFLWLKLTLSTEDINVTPTLLSLWIEEAEAPPDTILLTFDTYNRFNDVEGNITVSYLQAVGTLAGVRPVEDFSESFEPEDLEATPIDDHTITAGTEVEVEFIPVDYVSGFTDHTVAAASSLEVQLIPVGEIPP